METSCIFGEDETRHFFGSREAFAISYPLFCPTLHFFRLVFSKGHEALTVAAPSMLLQPFAGITDYPPAYHCRIQLCASKLPDSIVRPA